MKYSIERQKGEAIISFTADKAEWDKANVQAYEKSKHKFSMNGFRKGKVPMSILIKNYGEDIFFDDAFNFIFYDAFSNALNENKDLHPVDRPEITKVEPNDGGLKFEAKVTLKPEVCLGDYKGLKVTKVSYPVSDKDIDEEIDRALVRSSRKVEVTDRAAQKGDIANIDYSGQVDGEKFAGGTAEGHDLELGSNSFIEGFEEQVAGMKKDEEKAIKVTFPKEYHEKSLAGKEATFMVRLNSIFKKEKPELNEDFVKEVSEFQSVEEYKRDVEDKLKESNKKREESENQNSIIEAIVEKAQVDIPDCMIDECAEEMLEEFKYRLMYQGMNLEDYFKYTNTDKEALKKTYHPQAKKTVLTRLVLEKIVKDENLEITDEDKEAKIKELAEAAKKDVEEYRKSIDDRRMNYMLNEILSDKLLQFLKNNNELVEKE